MVEQPPQQLQGEVLERQCGAMEQLQHPQIGIQLRQRHGGRMAKPAIGVLAQPAQHFETQAAAGERRYHPRRHLEIRQPAHFP